MSLLRHLKHKRFWRKMCDADLVSCYNNMDYLCAEGALTDVVRECDALTIEKYVLPELKRRWWLKVDVLSQFVRKKPMLVTARRATRANNEYLELWCERKVLFNAGDWIVKEANGTFNVYTDEAFRLMHKVGHD